MPLQNSIKQILKYLITGNSDLLPRAKSTPSGKENIIPNMARIKVKANPPHSLLSTTCMPKDPWISINAIIGKIKIKKNKIYILNLSFTKKEVAMDRINIKKLKFILHIFSTG